MPAALSHGLQVRTPTMDDLDAVFALITTCDVAQFGSPDFTRDALRADWQSVDLDRDAWIITDIGGRTAGYAIATHRGLVRYIAQAYAHPDYYGQGIGTTLLRLMERRVRQRLPEAPVGARVTLLLDITGDRERAQRLFAQEGYTYTRTFWHMVIHMDDVPPLPEWAGKISVRTFVPGQDDRPVFEAVEEAFQDHWGHLPSEFEQWRRHIERANFDPTLWFLAMDDAEIAGVALCNNSLEGGHVDTLGVRRPWRRQGLGLALLRHAFSEFYRRDRPTVGLGVDSQNLTGAVRLYERVGMHVARQHEVYEKDIRPGADLSTQEIGS